MSSIKRVFVTHLLQQLKPELYQKINHAVVRSNICPVVVVQQQPPHSAIGPDCVLFTWNRHMYQGDMAIEFEKAGGHVVVFENSYLDDLNDRTYTIGYGRHNSPLEENLFSYDHCAEKIFRNFGADIRLIREHNQRAGRKDNNILIIDQSKTIGEGSIGELGYRQPKNWLDLAIEHAFRLNEFPNIEVRYHQNAKSSHINVMAAAASALDKRIKYTTIKNTVCDAIKVHSAKDISLDSTIMYNTHIITWNSNVVTRCILNHAISERNLHILGKGTVLRGCSMHSLGQYSREADIKRICANIIHVEDIKNYLFDKIENKIYEMNKNKKLSSAVWIAPTDNFLLDAMNKYNS